jgi:hypothetical protein
VHRVCGGHGWRTPDRPYLKMDLFYHLLKAVDSGSSGRINSLAVPTRAYQVDAPSKRPTTHKKKLLTHHKVLSHAYGEPLTIQNLRRKRQPLKLCREQLPLDKVILYQGRCTEPAIVVRYACDFGRFRGSPACSVLRWPFIEPNSSNDVESQRLETDPPLDSPQAPSTTLPNESCTPAA